MQRLILTLLAVLLVSGASADFADYVYVAPGVTKTAPEATKEALLDSAVSSWLEREFPVLTYGTFAGQREVLKAYAAKEGPQQVAEGFGIQVDADELVGEAFTEDGYTVTLGGVRSVDAEAIRLRADLIGFDDTDELWVIDPTVSRAFGPFTADDAEADGTWLPTVMGDTVVLILRSTDGAIPPLQVELGAHFFADPASPKYDVCPIPAVCESNTTVQEVSSGIGRIVLPAGSGGQYLCTGALVNNPTTSALEPLFLMANHCVDGIGLDASGVEVYWDYRSTACAANTTGTVPSLATVPRSTGAFVLAEDSTVDGELIELRGDIPVGEYGRAWLGWDTRTPIVDDALMGIHHPQGKDMKLAAGHVTHVDQSYTASRIYQHVTRVIWDEGITEGGSSGSPLLYRNLNCRILGMLSGGGVHNCATPETNYDYYASFRHFYGTYGGFFQDGPTALQTAWVLVNNWNGIDANTDGAITYAEADAALSFMNADLFAAVNVNGGSAITASEAQAFLAKGGPGCHAARTTRRANADVAVALAAAAILLLTSRRRTLPHHARR